MAFTSARPRLPVVACIAAGAISLVTLTAAAPDAVGTQPGAEAAARIETRSATIAGYLDLLKSQNQATRIAAFTEMATGGDPALADVAIESALRSPDPAMQALGLRAGFRQVRALVAKLSPNAGPEGEAVVKACGDAVQYRIEGFSFAKGTFEAQGQDHAGVGQVNGTTVSIAIEYGCSLTGKLQPDGTLAGIVSAPYKKGSLPMRASFR